MIEARAYHTATLLSDGRVLVAGDGLPGSAELYDPSRGSWAATGALIEARNGAVITLLSDGTVLAVGGFSVSGAVPLASGELYEPSSGSWIATGAMVVARFSGHTATTFPDGSVLVAGGFSNNTSDALASAELYDPKSGSWSATATMHEARHGHTGTLLRDGGMLVAGGHNSLMDALATTDLFHPVSQP
jgi:N-acetylneuraminic acid mutarotase